MNSVYMISLIVGGFFVLLSIFGGGETDSDVDVDADVDMDIDFDADVDIDLDADFDADADMDADLGAGVGFVDLLSVRALFLFAAFFGLTGVLLNLFGTAEPLVALLSVGTGLLCGLGGNYLIKRFAYASVSSNVTSKELRGRTAHVLLPFGANDRGKITVLSKGRKLQLIARPLDDESAEAFDQGDEVVIVRLDGTVAEVVKPT